MAWTKLDTRIITLSPQEVVPEWTLLDREFITIYPKEEAPPQVGWVKLDTRIITILPKEEVLPAMWTKLDTRVITLTPSGTPPIPPEEKPKAFPALAILLIGGAIAGGIALAAKRR